MADVKIQSRSMEEITSPSSSLYSHDQSENTQQHQPLTRMIDWSDFIRDSVLRDEPMGSFSQMIKVRIRSGAFLESSPSSPRDRKEEIHDYDYDDNEGNQRYTLKCLRRHLTAKEIASKALSLALEAQVLSLFFHPNIIQVVGMSRAFSESDSFHYFVLYNPLDVTLETLLDSWRRHPFLKRKLPLLRHRSNATRQKIKLSLHERVQLVAMGLCKAIAHVHCKGIAIRNIHPNTIGFDSKLGVKLFDFSQASPQGYVQANETTTRLATLMKNDIDNLDAVSRNLRLSGANHGLWKAVSTKAKMDDGLEHDVYAFGVIVWLVASLQQIPKDQNSVPNRFHGNRPGHWDVPSRRLRRIINSCWEADSNARPTSIRLNLMLLDTYGTSNQYNTGEIQQRSLLKLSESNNNSKSRSNPKVSSAISWTSMESLSFPCSNSLTKVHSEFL